MRSIKFIISGGGTGGHIYPALAIAYGIKDNYKNLESKVYTLPKEVDLKIAATKLGLMGGELEILTEEQIKYLDSWEHGTS